MMLTTREGIALHEAAHAVVALVLGLPLHSITVTCRSGETLLDGKWSPAAADRASFEAAVFSAGRVAMTLAGFESEAGSDDREIAAREAREPGVARRGCALGELVLRSHWGAVQKLAAVAIYGYLTREQARDFIESAPVAPLVCNLARLRVLGKRAGECEELTASAAFERLVELAADAPHRAERERLAAAHEQERLARLRALPPSPWERAAQVARAARAAAFNVRSNDPRVAEVRRELGETMARLALSETTTASRPVSKLAADQAHRDWLDRIKRGTPPRRVVKSRPYPSRPVA